MNTNVILMVFILHEYSMFAMDWPIYSINPVSMCLYAIQPYIFMQRITGTKNNPKSNKITGTSTVVLYSSWDSPVACVLAFCGQSGPDFH